jgi:type II secretory pathway pseudopilin PulG
MRHSNKSAFTLTELLVVIGIIMVLAAMVGSALHGARASAVRVQCLSNIRSLGQAALIYADSNNLGRVPDGGHAAGGSFTFSNDAALGTLYDPQAFNDLTLFICPSQKKGGMPVYDSAAKTVSSPYSYYFVKGKNIDSSSGSAVTVVEPQLNSYPSSNILLLELPSAKLHEGHGIPVFLISGKTQFIQEPIPKNKMRSGDDDTSEVLDSLYTNP